MWITINCGKFLKRWEYQTTLPASWETFVQVKKQQLEGGEGGARGFTMAGTHVHLWPIHVNVWLKPSIL